jgi:hypothetical protein
MERWWPRVRLAALLASGSLIVHELRYVAGYGSHYRQALAEQGHSYASWLEALAFALAAVAAVRFAVSLSSARRGVRADAGPRRFGRLWLVAATGLAAIYTVQEGLEGAFAPGHPGGLAGIYGHSGWTALLFSLFVGGLIALIMRLAHEVIHFVASRTGRQPGRREPARQMRLARGVVLGHRQEVLAWNMAGRAPPRRS